MVIDPPCASQVSSERKMPIVPSVVSPLNRPHSAPTASESAIAEAIKSGMLSIRPEFRKRIVRPETKAAIAPTERSSPPPVMTSVCPTAIVAMNVLRARTLVRLSKLRKRGLASAPSTQISARATNGATAATFTRRRVAAHQGRLARAVLADDRVDLAGSDADRDVAKHFDRPERSRKPGRFEDDLTEPRACPVPLVSDWRRHASLCPLRHPSPHFRLSNQADTLATS